MFESSGVNGDTKSIVAQCTGFEHDDGTPCNWEGLTDLQINPEIRSAIWTCPDCNAEHKLWLD